MTILFLAFEFPPLTAGGVQRPLKFAKYLPEFGIEPIVLTTDVEGFKSTMPKVPHDLSLLQQLSENLKVVRIPCRRGKPVRSGKFGEWKRIFFSLVESQADAWRPQLRRALPELIAKHQPSALYITAPPFCMVPLGCQIAKEFNLPLVLDMRDAWSQWRISPYASWLHYWLTCRLERRCLQAADRVVCTSNQTRTDFLRMHPVIRADKISVITNGYDEAIDDWTPDFHPGGEFFTIGYVGSFYYHPTARESMMKPWWGKRLNRMIQYAPRKEDWLYRSPFFFFQSLAHLIQKHPEHRRRLRIRFAGDKPDWIDSQVKEFGLQEQVEFVGRLNHPSVLKFQGSCDALLVTSSKVIGGNDYSIAGKTFEYLSLKKPIIGFVADGAQRELLAASGMALICDPDAPQTAAQQLHDLIEGRVKFKPNVPLLYQLHRRELTQQLAQILKSVAKLPLV